MRVFRIVVLAGLMAMPVAGAAWAQMMPGFKLNEGKQYTEEEKEQIRANEEAAKAARAKIPDGKVSSDPWASVRSEPAAKAPKAKTNSKTSAK